MTFRAALLILVAVIAPGLGGCALLTKSKPVDIRYFTPALAPTTASAPAASGRQLRLGRVHAASYLRERIAYREPGAEIGYYPRLRWAEPPEAFLRRGLARRLFQEQGVREIVSGTGPSLEVDLEAFEEQRGATPAARVQVTWRLRDQRVVLVQRTITVEKPIGAHGDEIAEALVAAMGQALDSVVASVTTEVIAALPTPPLAPATAETAAP
jgi:ABC-type uncharacterized transport system auxiliary subunit